MNKIDVIIIGAGAAGLMAAREIKKYARKQVTVLEARPRTGGRIYTISDPSFESPIEGGAEFLHGNVSLTLNLLKEAGIQTTAMEGDAFQPGNGRLIRQEDFPEGMPLMMSALDNLQEDMSFDDFLSTYFKEDKYAELVKGVRNFVEGYDAADIRRASAIAVRDEWSREEEDQRRVNGGYSKLIDFLAKEFLDAGGNLVLSQIVKTIRWKKGQVELSVSSGETYTCSKIIITIPLGIYLQNNAASLSFLPELPEQLAAIKALGYGAVIKIILQFNNRFWTSLPVEKDQEKSTKGEVGKNMKEKEPEEIKDDMGWIFSEEEIPTYWTQLPDESAILTGWVAGPRVEKWKYASDQEILEETLRSLASIFNTSSAEISKKLDAWKVMNWQSDPFSSGAYAYSTIGSPEARRIMNEPVEGTIFFSGEALHEGRYSGTVEAALENGKQVSERVIRSFNINAGSPA